jgi:IclR family transcriptional regulator, KDG regulon repressor
MELLKKAFTILDLFLEHDDELALEDLSRLSGLKKATVRRIALTLIEGGYLKQPEKRGKYSLGMRFLDFSGQIKQKNRIVNVANLRLSELSRKINETVMIFLWDGMKATLCQIYNSNHSLKVVPEEGTRLGMHNTSAGKIILAEMTDKELETYLSGGLPSFTPNTLTDINILKTHLALIRENGFALDDEEYSIGVRGLAVPLRIRNGKLVGVAGIIGPSARLSRSRLSEYIPLIQDCGRAISRELGYRDDNPDSNNHKKKS